MNIIGGLLDKAAAASGASWLTFLPWILLAWGASVAGSGAWGWHQGSTTVTAKYEAAKDRAAATAAAADIAAIGHALDISLQIVTTSRDFLGELNLSRMKRQQIVAKVKADVLADQKLAGCVVPAATVRLRRDQVAESVKVAADDRPM